MNELLIEVRCEELPFGMIAPALDALAAGLLELLDGVEHGEVKTFSTPRRIAVSIAKVATHRPVEEQLVTGPPLSAAQKNGEWTKAALGFAQSKGIDVSQLQIIESPKGSIIGATVCVGGESSVELVAAGLDRLVSGLPFKKSMRWGSGSTRWGRPIHQIIAMYNGQLIPTSVAGIKTSELVVGHRRSPMPPKCVTNKTSYLSSLREQWVLVDRDERRSYMVSALRSKAEELGVDVFLDPALVEEVTDLIEWPVVVSGYFDEELLQLPERLLVESMKVHQRTFPTRKDGRLHNLFLVVSNNPEGDPEIIGLGNARVLRARFYDARFFFAEDKKLPLETLGLGLKNMRWVQNLGTMADKQARLALQGPIISQQLGLGSTETTARAGSLTKCDLASQMVREFPELQGHMGRLYAEHQGESKDVALAIEEHYLPRYADDILPATAAGISLALADRLDTLCGCFSIGIKPKSSADPQGLRRAANGILSILLAGGYRVSLSNLIQLSSKPFEKEPDILETVDFFLMRLRSMLLAEGFRTDIVDAVLEVSGDDVVAIRARVVSLSELASKSEFKPLMEAFKRVLNISKDHSSPTYNRKTFENVAEHALADAFESAKDTVPEQLAYLEIGAALSTLVRMKHVVDDYLDSVFVMTENLELRTSRLGLLLALAKLFRSIADFRIISTTAETSESSE